MRLHRFSVRRGPACRDYALLKLSLAKEVRRCHRYAGVKPQPEGGYRKAAQYGVLGGSHW